MDGVATPNEQYKIGDTVSLSNFDDTGVTTWNWSIVSKPAGSTATVASPASATTSFVVDKEGTYLLSLIVNLIITSTAVARVLTVHAGLKALAKDEIGEGDSTEGWAKPWRESYLTIDKRLGLTDRRTVQYVDETCVGPRVLEMFGITSASNGDIIPIAKLGFTEFQPGFKGKCLLLFDSTGTLTTGDTVSALARGISNPFPDPDLAAGGSGLDFIGTGSLIFLNYLSGTIVGPYTYSGGSGFYDAYGAHVLGMYLSSGSEGQRFWFDPVITDPGNGHGQVTYDVLQNGLSYHKGADLVNLFSGGRSGFMTGLDKEKLDAIDRVNLLDNAAFDFWQRGSGSVVAEINTPFGDFTQDRAYSADRWYGVGRNNENVSASSLSPNAAFSYAPADSLSPQRHPRCMRVTNRQPTGSISIFGPGIQYWVVQEIDPNILKERISGSYISWSLRIRGGQQLGYFTTLFAGIIATNNPSPAGALPAYYNQIGGYSQTQFLSYGANIFGDWQTFSFDNGSQVFPDDVTAAAFVVFSDHPLHNTGSGFLSGDGSAYDYWEVSNIMLTTGSVHPDLFVNRGGTRENDFRNCRQWYETSWPQDNRDLGPFGTEATFEGARTGMVTNGTDRVSPGVVFRETKRSGSDYGTLQIQLYNPVNNAAAEVYSTPNGTISGSIVSGSIEGFLVGLPVAQTFGDEILLHYTASVDI